MSRVQQADLIEMRRAVAAQRSRRDFLRSAGAMAASLACGSTLALAQGPRMRIRHHGSSAVAGGFVLKTAANTGLLGAGISEGTLSTQGTTTYNTGFNGQTISGKHFTGDVIVTGTNITLSGCLFTWDGGDGNPVQNLSGVGGLTLVDCTLRCNSSTSGATRAAYVTQPGLTIRRCDISGAENCITSYASNVIIEDSFLHFPSSWNPGGHNDTIEIYEGDNIIVRRNTIILDHFTFSQAPTVAVNIAPWAGSDNVSNVTIEDNYIDGDFWKEIIIDTNQSGTHTVTNVRVLRNRFGGHNDGGDYGAGLGGGTIQETGAVTRVSTDTAGTDQYYYPSSASPDSNHWWYCRSNPFGFADLTPDRQGQHAGWTSVN